MEDSSINHNHTSLSKSCFTPVYLVTAQNRSEISFKNIASLTFWDDDVVLRLGREDPTF
jgi:hypothetical protein